MGEEKKFLAEGAENAEGRERMNNDNHKLPRIDSNKKKDISVHSWLLFREIINE